MGLTPLLGRPQGRAKSAGDIGAGFTARPPPGVYGNFGLEIVGRIQYFGEKEGKKLRWAISRGTKATPGKKPDRNDTKWFGWYM